ncbi:hypothetical protein MKX07_002543 [Trichoderma sp. CBMAI-0711]|nr:hypothetical protein MKX07_002543 [Trichoderma sp. CBMAI-0711]
MLKDFISQSHSDRPRHANKKDDVDEDEDLLSEDTIIDQPSYIDRERHSAGSAGPRAGSTTDSDSKYSVDDLCEAALRFASDTLKPGGHFVCKFYTGSEDKDLEKKLKLLFSKVYREKPDASRAESKEAYFVALFRKAKATIDDPATIDSTATDSHDQ